MLTDISNPIMRWPLRRRFEIGASLLPPIALTWLASRAGWTPLAPHRCLLAMPFALAIGMLFPWLFAGWHSILNRGQRWVGGYLLAGLLGLTYLVAIVPVGLWLRARGRSFLEPPSGASYWAPARPPGSLKDQY